MADDAIVAIYADHADALQGVEALQRCGFPIDRVTLLASASAVDTLENPAVTESVQAGDTTERTATTGAAVGGVLGLLGGATLLAIPGVGPVVAAGALAAGLTGAIVGGVLGAMSGWGIHEDQMRQYADDLQAGRVVVIGRGHPLQLSAAKAAIDRTSALQVQMHVANSADSPEIDDRSGRPN